MASSEPAGEPGGEAKPSPGKGGKVKYVVLSCPFLLWVVVFADWDVKVHPCTVLFCHV